MRSLLTILLLFLSATVTARATTWDEPWHENVLKNTDSFVKVRVVENQGPRAKAEVVKFIAGIQTPQQLELAGFSMLRLMSTSSGDHGPQLSLKPGQVYYLLVKKEEKTNAYQIPTPTSGWAQVVEGDVYATYRHSYHQAVVPEDVYEKTMHAIFNGTKGKPYDTEYVSAFLKEQLTQSVANWKGENDPVLRKKFFLQHVALEAFYHLGKGAELSQLVPFMGGDSYHVQISACRAVSRSDSKESGELLMKFIEGKGEGFAKVMCVWGLKRQNARELIPRLEAFLKTGTDQETGFGGSIMDPRVGTLFPDSVKWSIRQLLRDWGRPAPNNAFNRTRHQPVFCSQSLMRAG